MSANDDDELDEAVPYPMNGVLDLHSFAPREVADLVSTWLDECQRLGLRELRIVHGKGVGNLRRTVHSVLSRRRDVVRFQLAEETRGGWGATLVWLSLPGT